MEEHSSSAGVRIAIALESVVSCFVCSLCFQQPSAEVLRASVVCARTVVRGKAWIQFACREAQCVADSL